MRELELKRGYEVLPDNNVRFGIRVINSSDYAISDVEVILDYRESLFVLEGSKIQNLGTIPPTTTRTAEFILKPRGCIHKEEIGATVRYKDHLWTRHTQDMRPKVVHCVCPYLKEKSLTRADFLALSNSGYLEERGVNFEGITVAKLVDFILHTCKRRLYSVDEFSIERGKILYLAGDALGEKAYYLLTAVVNEHDGITQVLLRAASDKKHGLNGFLNEIVDNLRHLVSSVVSAREIGVIKKEQVINIIDSVVQRTTFAAGEGAALVTIKDSVVQRTEIKGDEEAKRRRDEEERLRKKEEEEREHVRREEDGNMLGIKVADETWIGCALLHLENPERVDFTVMEIVQRVAQENIYGELRPGINWHANLHCVANKAPNPGNYRMLYETQKGRRRLFRDGDTYHPLREGKKTKPSPSAIHPKYHYLLKWYEEVYNKISKAAKAELTTPEKEEQERVRKKKEEPERLAEQGNSIDMKFTLIPAGEFNMGSEEENQAKPVHKVKINNPFYLGTYPVTQREWKVVMDNNHSFFKGDDLPVELVSWDDVQEFIKKLNEKEGTDKYRLPSEAEWEYACRAGTTTRYSFGDDESKLGDYAWYSKAWYSKILGCKTHPVGQKKPNQWGLYDMPGNVWEWVQDTFHDGYNGTPADGSAWEGDGYRVGRGGSWFSRTRICRSAIRYYHDQGYRSSALGFRLLREV